LRSLQAVLFDFDGVILDTEWPIYQTWKELLADFQVELPLLEWTRCLGTSSDAFDPIAYLRQHTDQPVNPHQLLKNHRLRTEALIAQESLQPGVIQLLTASQSKGIKTAIVSSSPAGWVLPLLRKYRIDSMFDAYTFGNEVPIVKPDPIIYKTTLDKLGVSADQAIALEDSPNGIISARNAHIYTIGVSTRINQFLNISAANRIVSSLLEVSLDNIFL
jgi:putative hydrolase of the HAD superfamily